MEKDGFKDWFILPLKEIQTKRCVNEQKGLVQ
jgi:hypothetical protein